MKSFIWGILRFLILSTIICSSGLAIITYFNTSDFDPIREIIHLKQEDRRDDALDLTRFLIENGHEDKDRLEKLRKDLKYSFLDKLGSFSKGAIKGKVYDIYSGIGAISSDLCIYGDIRDLGIQGWYYFKGNPEFDGIVLGLSSIGILLSTRPILHGVDSSIKNTKKYVKRFYDLTDQGILKKFVNRRLPLKESKKVWTLLKENSWSIPRTVSCLRSIPNTKHLDSALHLIKNHKRTGNVFINLTGENGLLLYQSIPLRLKDIFIRSFRHNPKSVLGLTRIHFIIHSIKILDKYKLTALLVPFTVLSMILSYLPIPLVWAIFIGSSAYSVYVIGKKFKQKPKKKEVIEC